MKGYHSGNFLKYTSKEEINQKLQQLNRNHHNYIYTVNAIWEFSKEMKHGDIVYVKKGQNDIVGWGVVSSKHQYKNGKNIHGFGETSIFIYPPYKVKSIDCLITNLHTPYSTLLMLVSAFAGYELIMKAYGEAVAENYRFFSYGDAMLIL